MQKIVPHLWYDTEAAEATKWYVSLFENSGITARTTIQDTPSGDAELLDFHLANLTFSAISAGPYFKFNPSVSLMIACNTFDEVDYLHENLSVGGTVLMPLGEYPFSKRYVWLEDKYGLGWQLMFVENRENQPRIRPCLLFSGEACGKASQAIEFYTSVFEESSKGVVNKYATGEAMDSRAKINYAELKIRGLDMVLMDHGFGADFTFNEAFSLMVPCDTQEEIDYFWDRLSFVPEAEQCGWLKDQFGFSWQIVPSNMDEVMMNGTKEESMRVTEAFLKMKKFDLQALEKARLG